MERGKKKAGMDRRTFIRLGSGAIAAVSGNWFLPKFALGAEEVLIGGLCELSGPASIMGTEQARGMELAVDLYNQKGGVLGKKIKLLMEDTESKKDVGLAKARRLVERSKVNYLAGIIFSAVSMAVQQYIREKKILFVNSGSGNDALIQPPYCDHYFFKAPGSFRLTSLSIREPAKKFDKWYFIGDDYSWGKGCVEYFKKSIELVRKNYHNVGEAYPPFGETNYAPYVTKMMAANPEAVGIAVFGAGWARTVSQARQMGFKGHIHHQFWDLNNARATGDAVIGMTSSSEFLNENPKAPRAKVFSDAYKQKFGNFPGEPRGLRFPHDRSDRRVGEGGRDYGDRCRDREDGKPHLQGFHPEPRLPFSQIGPPAHHRSLHHRSRGGPQVPVRDENPRLRRGSHGIRGARQRHGMRRVHEEEIDTSLVAFSLHHLSPPYGKV